jgi:hypothetical protein
MAVFLAEVADAEAAGFEDPQSQQSEQGNEREVVDVVRQPGGGNQGFELQMSQPPMWVTRPAPWAGGRSRLASA